MFGLALAIPLIGLAQELPPPPAGGEELPTLTEEQLRDLKPRHVDLGILPRAKVDLTAYTLEPGEVRLGLATASVGLLPRMHAGTSLVFDAIGLYNGHLKFNAVRIGGFDLAVQGSVYGLPIGDFYGQYSGAALIGSVILSDALSVHAGVEHALLEFRGIPDLSEVSPLLLQLAGQDPDSWEMDPDGLLAGIRPRFQGDATWANVGAELRLNRRDSFILRGSAVVQAQAHADVNVDWEELNLPPIAGLDQTFSTGGRSALEGSWTGSLSYQASWKQVDLRVGVGASAVSWAWLVKSAELSYRFGGETRQYENRARKGWRRSRRRDLPPSPPPP
ncbi:MAG: hypothetical protein JXX28_06560 [Deltaproteobacteria bacterium]|nr:hypothetical protein [Deltaproteobacteria bacterium]